MPVNAHPEYLKAERRYYEAGTDEQRLEALEKMVKSLPTHKGAENLRKNIRTRYKKLKQELLRKSRKKSGKKGIKKADMQAVLVGLTNSGKSSILKAITNAHPKIASYGYTTTEPEVGTLNHQGTNIQIIDLPPISSEHFDQGAVNNADTILIVIEKVDEIRDILKIIENNITKNKPRVIIFNKIDQFDAEKRRKIKETLRSRKHNFALTSTITDEGLEELKEKILSTFNIIRVYTRHPGKKQKLDKVPIILPPNSTLQDVAEKILHGYSKKVKYAKVTGPSAKFKNQRIGLKHKVKDKDIVEFYTD